MGSRDGRKWRVETAERVAITGHHSNQLSRFLLRVGLQRLRLPVVLKHSCSELVGEGLLRATSYCSRTRVF